MGIILLYLCIPGHNYYIFVSKHCNMYVIILLIQISCKFLFPNMYKLQTTTSRGNHIIHRLYN